MILAISGVACGSVLASAVDQVSGAAAPQPPATPAPPDPNGPKLPVQFPGNAGAPKLSSATVAAGAASLSTTPVRDQRIGLVTYAEALPFVGGGTTTIDPGREYYLVVTHGAMEISTINFTTTCSVYFLLVDASTGFVASRGCRGDVWPPAGLPRQLVP